MRDQITHLAYFDRVAVVSITDPAAFLELRAEAAADMQGYFDASLAAGHGRTGAEMLAWFAAERAGLAQAVRDADPSDRVEWFGPPMSVASKATARLMETWAHGQDVVDALGFDRPATSRLRHVAHIGARALPNSYRARGMPVPDVAVHVELLGPDGDVWTWGDPAAADRVRGDALDFCLVVTQRRHVSDTGLEAVGPVAEEWLQIAQAFAGPAGKGRSPA